MMHSFNDESGRTEGEGVTLSPEDAAIVDAILNKHEAVAPSACAERVGAWLSVVGSASVPEGPATLVERTLARVQRDRMMLNSMPRALEPAGVAPRYSRLRLLREFAAMAVAASILGAVITVGVAQARQSARRVACASNLITFANAFSTYASVSEGELPSLPTPTDHNWLRPNPAFADSHTNTDNLRPLINASLIRPVNLICPGRPGGDAGTDAGRGYSYANLFGPDHPQWDHTHATIVLADRNPLFDPRAPLDPQMNSTNHGLRGSYVLRADGSVTWETSPNIGVAHDNIWTIGTGPQYRTTFAGMETTSRETDTFLSP